MVRKNRTNKAFTLIEVLIVTAIISLVASIVNSQMSEARQKADDAHMKTEVQQVRTAVEQYRQKKGTVPVNVGSYASGSTYQPGEMAPEGSDEYKDAMQELVDEGYMPEIPTSPNGQSYSYLATADGQDAVFAANLNNEDSGSGGSGSSSNSCEVVEENIEWGDCQFVNSWDCVETENYACFADYSIADNCSQPSYPTCTSETLSSDFPQEICDYHYPGDSYSGSCEYRTASSGWGCEKTSSGVCTGSSNSDYCSCI